MKRQWVRWIVLVVLGVGTEVYFLPRQVFAQSGDASSAGGSSKPAIPVTIPIRIRMKGAKPEPELQMIDVTVNEDGEPQTVLSIRAMASGSPITLAVLVQDDVVPSIANEIKALSEFIRGLPKGSRV